MYIRLPRQARPRPTARITTRNHSRAAAVARTTAVALAIAAILGIAPLSASAATNDQACWGQATAVFAATGQLGQHAFSEPTPRLGLANLAEALFNQGVIPAPTLQALGAFVAEQLHLSIGACM